MLRRRRQPFGLAPLLGKDRNVGKRRLQHRHDDPLGGEVGGRDRGAVGLLADVEILRIDPHDRLAGREGGAPGGLEQRLARDKPGQMTPSSRSSAISADDSPSQPP